MSLSPEMIEAQKQSLIAEKKRIEAELKILRVRPDYGFDEEDSIRELVDYENNMPIKDQFEIILEKINTALKAIEKGTYGLCSKCEKAITEGRLKAMPYADICTSCQKTSKK